MQPAAGQSYWNVDGHGTANEFERVILNPMALGAQHKFSKGAGLAISIAVGIATAGIFQGITALVSYGFSKKNGRVFFKMPDTDQAGATSIHNAANVTQHALGEGNRIPFSLPPAVAPSADADLPPVISNDPSSSSAIEGVSSSLSSPGKPSAVDASAAVADAGSPVQTVECFIQSLVGPAVSIKFDARRPVLQQMEKIQELFDPLQIYDVKGFNILVGANKLSEEQFPSSGLTYKLVLTGAPPSSRTVLDSIDRLSLISTDPKDEKKRAEFLAWKDQFSLGTQQEFLQKLKQRSDWNPKSSICQIFEADSFQRPVEGAGEDSLSSTVPYSRSSSSNVPFSSVSAGESSAFPLHSHQPVASDINFVPREEEWLGKTISPDGLVEMTPAAFKKSVLENLQKMWSPEKERWRDAGVLYLLDYIKKNFDELLKGNVPPLDNKLHYESFLRFRGLLHDCKATYLERFLLDVREKLQLRKPVGCEQFLGFLNEIRNPVQAVADRALHLSSFPMELQMKEREAIVAPLSPSQPSLSGATTEFRPLSQQIPLETGKNHLEMVSQVLRENGLEDPSPFGVWYGIPHFGTIPLTEQATNCSGYESSRRLWKIFLNPKREHFYTVFNRFVEVMRASGLNCEAKITQDRLRKSNQSSLDDPNEPKIILYIVGATPAAAEEKLKKAMAVLEDAFTEEEVEKYSCPKGMRYQGSELAPQWGPSFTHKRNALIQYSQGGFVESGREENVVSGTLEENFEGDNFYRYVGTKDPLQGSERIIRSVNERFIKFKNYLSKKDFVGLESFKKQLYDASLEKKIAHAHIVLNKPLTETLSDEDVARCNGICLVEYRTKKIMESWFQIRCECASSNTPVPVFSKDLIAKKLGIDEKTVDQWLEDGEVLLGTYNDLDEFGTEFSEEKIQGVTVEQIPALRTKVTEIFERVTKNADSFSKPYSILKIYNILVAMRVIASKTSQQQSCLPLFTQGEELLGMLLRTMDLQRQGALWELMNGPKTPKELREKIGGILWGSTQIGMYRQLDGTAGAPESVQARIEKTIQRTDELLQIVETNPQALSDDLLKKFPRALQEIYQFSSPGYSEQQKIELIKKKLENVRQRQLIRRNQIAKGETVQLPLFFHGTKDADMLFSIATTGIRAVQQRGSRFGAFVSTQPAMLRYGSAIIGLPERVAFSSRLAKNKNQDCNALLPDAMIGLSNSMVFRDFAKEKWAGLERLISINPQEHELRAQFMEYLTFILSQTKTGTTQLVPIQDAYVVEQIRAELVQSDIQMEFVLDEGSQTHGFWKPILSREGRREEITEKFLRTLIATVGQKVGITLSPEDGILSKIQDFFNRDRSLSNQNMRTEVVAGQLRVHSSRSPSLSPYFIALDEEELGVKFLWKLSTVNIAEDAKVSIQEVRSQLEKILKSSISSTQTRDEQERDAKRIQEFLDTHCVPLFEQLIEFDLQSKDMNGGPVLQSWESNREELFQKRAALSFPTADVAPSSVVAEALHHPVVNPSSLPHTNVPSASGENVSDRSAITNPPSRGADQVEVSTSTQPSHQEVKVVVRDLGGGQLFISFNAAKKMKEQMQLVQDAFDPLHLFPLESFRLLYGEKDVADEVVNQTYEAYQLIQTSYGILPETMLKSLNQLSFTSDVKLEQAKRKEFLEKKHLFSQDEQQTLLKALKAKDGWSNTSSICQILEAAFDPGVALKRRLSQAAQAKSLEELKKGLEKPEKKAKCLEILSQFVNSEYIDENVRQQVITLLWDHIQDISQPIQTQIMPRMLDQTPCSEASLKYAINKELLLCPIKLADRFLYQIFAGIASQSDDVAKERLLVELRKISHSGLLQYCATDIPNSSTIAPKVFQLRLDFSNKVQGIFFSQIYYIATKDKGNLHLWAPFIMNNLNILDPQQQKVTIQKFTKEEWEAAFKKGEGCNLLPEQRQWILSLY